MGQNIGFACGFVNFYVHESACVLLDFYLYVFLDIIMVTNYLSRKRSRKEV